MIRKFIGLVYFVFCAAELVCQSSPATFSDTSFYYSDAKDLEVIGQLPGAANFDRLPAEAVNKVSKEVWWLSKNSAGISVRFISNAPVIKVKWLTRNFDLSLQSQALTAVKGLDIYCKIKDTWQYVGLGVGSRLRINEAVLIEGMDTTSKEFLVNLPLFCETEKVEIGVPRGFTVSKPKDKFSDQLPVVVYGTSITQGGAAGRPGMAYPSMLARYFKRNIINLGFSGHGTFDPQMAEFILSADPQLVILDCAPNSPPLVISKNLPVLVEALKSKKPTLPILIVEGPMREDAYVKTALFKMVMEQNEALKKTYAAMVKKGIGNLFYLPAKYPLGNDHEGTSDGIHPNDLGCYRMFEFMKDEIIKMKLIK